jgi:hypothetical protein
MSTTSIVWDNDDDDIDAQIVRQSNPNPMRLGHACVEIESEDIMRRSFLWGPNSIRSRKIQAQDPFPALSRCSAHQALLKISPNQNHDHIIPMST